MNKFLLEAYTLLEEQELIIAYRSSPVQNFDYKSINPSMELGINCGTLNSAKAKHGINKYIDKITFIPQKILFSEDAQDFDQIFTPKSFLLSKEHKDKLENLLKIAKQKEENLSAVLREYLINLGYDCVQYKNMIEDEGSQSYIILDPTIITSIEHNIKK